MVWLPHVQEAWHKNIDIAALLALDLIKDPLQVASMSSPALTSESDVLCVPEANLTCLVNW